MSEVLLHASGVSKSFPGVKALDDVQLTLYKGEVLGLIGENGAGKSTLMKLLSGIYTPDSGRFEIDGAPLQVLGPRDALEQGISIIHQEFNLMNDLTVAQNIFIGREEPSGGLFLSDRDLNRRTQELIDRLGMPLRPTDVVADLTVAHQQMVEIAKALSYDARVLIMDEPTAALNEAEVARLFELIRRFVSPQTGVIYISHRMPELRTITDRITVLRDGQYVDTRETATTTLAEVIPLMVGRDVSGEARQTGRRAGDDVVLEVRDLSTADLLRDVSFDLHRGEILGFAGLMGAGRTETARALVGADRRTGGTIRLHGRPVTIRRPADAVRLGIGYLSEDRRRHGLMLDQTVRANILLSTLARFVGALGVMKDRAMNAVARERVEALRIKTPSIRQEVGYLSGGNQQKVVVAKWLVRDCEVLIFDEPTRGIDVGAKDEIYRLLETLAADGKSIIVISSELQEVLRVAHRIVVMSEGRVTGVLDNAEADQENVMHLATKYGHEKVDGDQ